MVRKKGPVHVEPEPLPLIETNSALAIRMLDSLVAKIQALDPKDRGAIRDVESYVHGDVKKVFGVNSSEYDTVLNNSMLPDENFLGRDDDDYDPYGDPLQRDAAPRAVAVAKTGIDKMLKTVRRLADRARELVALHAEGEDSMPNPFKVLEENLVLIKSDGTRQPFRGLWATDDVTVHNRTFFAARGDVVERKHPNGVGVEHREVESVSFQQGIRGGIPDAYHLKLRSPSAHATAPAPASAGSIVNHTYNIQGSTIGAVGENATVASSHVIGQVTQWNGADPKAIAGEVKTLRKELAATAAGDGADAEQAEKDLEHVIDANKALAANDEGGFKSAMKRLSAFGLKVVERVAMTATLAYLRAHGALPPAPHHEALPPGE